MANPQLVTYIKQQLQTGETEAPIKNSLKSVGWNDSDINEAFKEASPPITATPASPQSSHAVSSQPSTGNPMATQVQPKTVVEPKKFDLGAFAPMSGGPSLSRPTASPATISFSAQKPIENVFTPSAAPAQPKKSVMSIVGTVLMGLIIVGLAALSGLLYKNNTELKAKVTEFTNQVSALTGKVNTSGQASADLNQRIAKLEDDVKDIDSQLALFLPLKMVSTTVASNSSSSSSSAPVVISSPEPLTLKGTLEGGDKVNYTLKTSRGITVNIKNSKDAKVVSLLKPLVGNAIEITGVPTSGAREVTITHVNGAPIN